MQGNWNPGDITVSVGGEVVGTLNGVSGVDSSDAINAIRESMKPVTVSMEGRFRLKESKRLSPTLRKHFKDVRIGDQLYE